MRKIITCILLFCSLAACSRADLEVTYYNVGKADAIQMVTSGGHRIILDTGTNKEGKELARSLQEAGVTTIDLLILSHYDKDHVGGADHFLERFDIGTVLGPDYEEDSKQMDQLRESLEKKKERMFIIEAGQSLDAEIDGIEIHIEAPEKERYTEDNDYSLVTWIKDGEVMYLFTGDAEEARTDEILKKNLACEVIKMPHHGRIHANSQALIEKSNPQIAVITDSEEEPGNEVLISFMEDRGIKVFCTKDGDIRVVSDGKNVKAEQ